MCKGMGVKPNWTAEEIERMIKEGSLFPRSEFRASC